MGSSIMGLPIFEIMRNIDSVRRGQLEKSEALIEKIYSFTRKGQVKKLE